MHHIFILVAVVLVVGCEPPSRPLYDEDGRPSTGFPNTKGGKNPNATPSDTRSRGKIITAEPYDKTT